MTQAQELKLKSYLHLREKLAKVSLLVNSENVNSWYLKFLEKLETILKIKQAMEEDNKTIFNYCEIKDNLINDILIISRKMTTFSLLEEMIYLQGNFGYTKDELLTLTDQKLIKTSTEILGLIESHRADVNEYGITKSLENRFRNNMEQFKMIVETIKISEENLLANTSQISLLIQEVDEILESKLNIEKNITFVN